MHAKARLALTNKYKSKFTIDFELAEGQSMDDYHFVWASEEDLKKKVLDDVVWVRERYAQAGKDEPTDDELIAWYDAEKYVVDSDAGTQCTVYGSYAASTNGGESFGGQ